MNAALQEYIFGQETAMRKVPYYLSPCSFPIRLSPAPLKKLARRCGVKSAERGIFSRGVPSDTNGEISLCKLIRFKSQISKTKAMRLINDLDYQGSNLRELLCLLSHLAKPWRPYILCFRIIALGPFLPHTSDAPESGIPCLTPDLELELTRDTKFSEHDVFLIKKSGPIQPLFNGEL